MDFPIIVLAVFIIGVYKVFITRTVVSVKPVVAESNVADVEVTPMHAELVVRGNLELKREQGAFTAIVREMGLM